MFDLTTILEETKDKLIAVAFQDLETDAEYFLNADLAFHPASTFKVHVMMEVFRQANEGWLSLEKRLPIINSFTSIADGSKYSLDVTDTWYRRRDRPSRRRGQGCLSPGNQQQRQRAWIDSNNELDRPT